MFWLDTDHLNGKAYAHGTSSKSWWGARDSCQIDNATLASVATEEEFNFLSSRYQNPLVR